MKDLINRLHQSKFLGRVFPTLNHCLQRELVDCASVLDVGCGPSSPLQYCRNIKYSVGVEPFEPYLEKSKTKGIHTEYFNKEIEELDFDGDSFDAVIMLELIEHLPEEKGLEVLRKAERWARRKVVVSTPNGFIPQKDMDDNLWQKHLSGWNVEKMRSLGYKCRGLAGLKFLRQENQEGSMAGGSLFSSIRFRPRPFWFLIATLSQSVTYWFPELAFGLFGVKNVAKNLVELF